MKACILALLTVFSAAAWQMESTVKFSATTNLVILNVTVRDRSGKPMGDLTQEDFTVLEDGKRQTVSVFELQRLDDPKQPPVPPAPTPTLVGREGVIASITPGKIQYRDRRLLVLFFDFSSMPAEDLIRARDGALKFIAERMNPADLVAVMSFGTRLKVLQDFTADRDLLAATIRGVRIGESSDLALESNPSDEDVSENTSAAFLADETEFNLFNTDRKLSALETAAKMLSSLPEKKALVYFSSGIGKTGIENLSQLRSTVNAAVRSNVAFYPVDARGLMALPPGGDAMRAAPKGTGLFTGQTQFKLADTFHTQQQTLYTLAADTGGRASLDSNDLSLGIAQAQRDIRSYYILGYYSTNSAEDGRFRRTQVKLAGHPEARLDYRAGYFARKQFRKFTGTDKERQLEDALMLGDPVTDLPLALEINYFRLRPLHYFVPVAVKIPTSRIPLTRKGSEEFTTFDFIGQVRDPKGKLLATVRDAIQVKLNQEAVAQQNRKQFQYDTGFSLAAGRYHLKFLVREQQTGQMGTFETDFQVPDPRFRQPFQRISSIVWSNQREPVSSAIGKAGAKEKLMAVHPLVRNGQKLIPSITHVFRRDQTLYVYLELYDPNEIYPEQGPSIATTARFFRGDRVIFETEPVVVRQLVPGRPGTLAIELQTPLHSLEPGQYVCQLNIIDQVARTFALPRTSLVILP